MAVPFPRPQGPLIKRAWARKGILLAGRGQMLRGNGHAGRVVNRLAADHAHVAPLSCVGGDEHAEQVLSLAPVARRVPSVAHQQAQADGHVEIVAADPGLGGVAGGIGGVSDRQELPAQVVEQGRANGRRQGHSSHSIWSYRIISGRDARGGHRGPCRGEGSSAGPA